MGVAPLLLLSLVKYGFLDFLLCSTVFCLCADSFLLCILFTVTGVFFSAMEKIQANILQWLKHMVTLWPLFRQLKVAPLKQRGGEDIKKACNNNNTRRLLPPEFNFFSSLSLGQQPEKGRRKCQTIRGLVAFFSDRNCRLRDFTVHDRSSFLLSFFSLFLSFLEREQC